MLTKEKILKVADLAKLKLTDKEVEVFGPQMAAILQHFEELSVLDTKGVQPLVNPNEIAPHMRDDDSRIEFNVEKAVRNAPQVRSNLFKVPPVV